ncbi:MAG: hypothetical protein RIC51_09455, partial [Erythrobacter sp.]
PVVPNNMRPGMPIGPAASDPARSTPPPPSSAPAPSAASAGLSQPGKRSLADIERMIAALRDTAWEYVEPASDDARRHRYDFLAEGDLVVHSSTNGDGRFAQVLRLSAEDAPHGAFIRTREMNSGAFGDLPIVSLAADRMVYQKRYVRTGEEWAFRKVGPATRAIPQSAPQPLGDGFWRADFNPVSKNRALLGRQRLSGFANAANRDVANARLLGSMLYLVVPNDVEGCTSACFLVLNAVDARTRRTGKRLIEASGVDFVGVRPAGPDTLGTARRSDNAASVRAYDGLGGWTEWFCTESRAGLDCRKTGKRAPPPAATAATASAMTSTNAIASRLSAVRGEAWGAAQCFGHFYLAPASRGLVADVRAMFGFTRSNPKSLVATLIDAPGAMNPSLKLVIDGRERVLASAGERRWAAQGIAFAFRPSGPMMSDNPAYGFTPGRATLTLDARSETIEMVEFGGC